MTGVNGVHHITAIAGPAQENLDFYAGVLGMRLVKRSVNQDDPTTYHLFYADAEGHPGLGPHVLPVGADGAAASRLRSRDGGRPRDSAGQPRFLGPARSKRYGTPPGPVQTRFGQRVLAFSDPHGLHVALVEAASARSFTPWDGSPVPHARQVRGLHGAQLWERNATATKRFLTTVLGFEELPPNAAGRASAFAAPPACVDVRDAPEARRGAWGVGSVHHLAWRVDDEAHQAQMRARIVAAGTATDAGDRSLLVQVGVLQGAGRRAVRAGHRRAGVRRRRGCGASGRDAGAAAVARGAPHID